MKFQKDFLFGSATSAHQIEGNQKNDWSEWENIPGHIHDGSNSQITADSWNKWKEDIELLKSTHQNAYRFSIEWSRIEPEEGNFDQNAIEHYKDILIELRNSNIKSMVTLFHFTLPLWLAKKGGFNHKKAPAHFARFTKEVALKLGNSIDHWSILNEPVVYVQKGYIEGTWCPGRRNIFEAVKVYFSLIKAHKLSTREIKSIYPEANIGIAMAIISYLPYSENFFDKLLVRIIKYFSFNHFLSSISNELDFIGINYYFRFLIPMFSKDNTTTSDLGWHLHPEGVYETIRDQAFRKKPIYITENGVADKDDKLRPKYLKDCLESIERLTIDKVDVRGYFHWSLMDNFEWAEGYHGKFGLFTIDRKPRKSAFIYRDLIDQYSLK